MSFIQKRVRHVRNKQTQNKKIYDEIKKENKRRRIERNVFLETLAADFMLVPEMIHNAPVVTMRGRSSVRIENYKKILEYKTDGIKLQANDSIINIEGKNLTIKYYTKEEMVISGILYLVAFL